MQINGIFVFSLYFDHRWHSMVSLCGLAVRVADFEHCLWYEFLCLISIIPTDVCVYARMSLSMFSPFLPESTLSKTSSIQPLFVALFIAIDNSNTHHSNIANFRLLKRFLVSRYHWSLLKWAPYFFFISNKTHSWCAHIHAMACHQFNVKTIGKWP